MNIAPISFMTSSSGQHEQMKTSDDNAFARIIASLRQEAKPLQQSVQSSEKVRTVDWEQLQQWFAQLPAHDGYADKQTLCNDVVQAFLSLLPEDMKNDITERFSSEQPLEAMFAPTDDRNEKDELMLVVALFQLEQKQWAIPEQIIEYARATFRHVFGAHDEQNATIQAMLQNIVNNQLMLLNNAQKMVEWPFQQQQSWLPVHEQLAPMQRIVRTFDLLHAQQAVQSRMPLETQTSETPLASQMKRIVRMPSELHAVQQSAEKNVPIEVQTVNTTSETPFASQIERIVRASQFTQWKNGNAQLLIRLHPEHLGYVTIKLIQQKGKLTAKMITSTEAAKQLVEQHIHQLAHIADQVTVEQFNVFDEAKFRDHAFHQQKQQQQQQQQKEEKKQPDQSFDEWLKELFHFDV
ncbi:flagellar hook-length control protein FliK [Anoxybacillus flavithermus]|uniref:Flagellar hook-length control protein FliK n=1 Tax=Anoxybacillus flavithermus AK1 TaxID=1297581 RepID=M8CZK8_9BACL|nr:flagellar hook-length control protein FliK [Anoxybacillus flavithermus]EMT46898.1 flagellar hook-length control protein FliK [Anoxybacillus flavithermus AK1]